MPTRRARCALASSGAEVAELGLAVPAAPTLTLALSLALTLTLSLALTLAWR